MAEGEIHEAIRQRLRASGQTYTPARRRLVDVLEARAEPLTLPQLQDADRTLTQSSTYRNLAILEQAGAVTRVVTHSDHARFELAEDLTGHHHHHLVCSKCGDVSDFSLSADFEAELERTLTRVARRARYDIDHHRLDLVGRCANCR